MMIYTSYFGRTRELEQNGIEPIAISRGIPNGFRGRRIMSLAPTWDMLKMSDEAYNRRYEEILLENDRDSIVESFEGKDVALLCWEKDENDCHRKRVAEWLREGGYEAKEYKSEKELKKQAELEEKARQEKEEEQAQINEPKWQQLKFY